MVGEGRGARSVVRSSGEGRPVVLGDAGLVTLKVESGDSGGALSAYEFAMPPATAGPPLHLHRTWDEVFYVLDGTMTFLIDGVTHVVSAGGLVFVPRGVLHTFWNDGFELARQLTLFTPAGIEAYFDAVSTVLADGGEDALAEAEALMAAHDMVVPEGAGPAYGPRSTRGDRA